MLPCISFTKTTQTLSKTGKVATLDGRNHGFFNEKIGPYPYKQYSVVHGGDGGMEYTNAYLITGNRKFGSLVGVTAHELAHSWFQHILATNETKHEWMDEGFTSFISTLAVDKVLEKNQNFRCWFLQDTIA